MVKDSLNEKRCLLLVYLTYKKKWLEIKAINRIDRSPCKELSYFYVIDLDQLKKRRKVSISGEYLKQLASCDALLVNKDGNLTFIEFKSLRELVKHATSDMKAKENINKFNLRDKIEESFWLIRELIARLDKGDFLKFLSQESSDSVESIEDLVRLLNFNEVYFLIISEDEEDMLSSIMWPALSLQAIFGELNRVIEDTHNSISLKCRIKHMGCKQLRNLDFSFIQRVKERKCYEY